jgi:hypothetical protein
MTNDVNLARRDFLKALSVTLGAVGAATTLGTNLVLAQDDLGCSRFKNHQSMID